MWFKEKEFMCGIVHQQKQKCLWDVPTAVITGRQQQREHV
jgi:hypothetical protein